jgi:hypothetical protein
MRLPERPLRNPTLNPLNLGRFQLPMGLRWRHDLIRVGATDAQQQRTQLWFAWHHGNCTIATPKQTFASVQPQPGLARSGVWSVAMETGIGENGPDVPIEYDLGTDVLGQAKTGQGRR